MRKYRVVRKSWGAYYVQQWSWLFFGWADICDDGFQSTEAAVEWLRATEHQPREIVTWQS